MSQEPIEWHSAAWWRNRPESERLSFLKIPKRIQRQAEANRMSAKVDAVVANWEPGDSLYIQGPSGSGKSTYAASLLTALVKSGKISGRWVSTAAHTRSRTSKPCLTS